MQLFASQPIYGRNKEIFAHELLYRSDKGFTALDIGDEAATTELVFNLCTGIAEYVEHFKEPVCINVSAEFLLSKAFLPIDPEFVIIELVERITPTPEIVRAVRAWVNEGFRFALDDFEFQPEWEPLLELACMIKVDIEQTTFSRAAKLFKEFRHLDVLWLAERVEDEYTYDAYRNLGFDLFQGFYLARPQIVEGTKVPPGAVEFTMLIDKLFCDEPDINEVTEALSSDAMLVVNLLRIVNSPYYGSRRKIESVKEVIVMIGIEPLRKWVLLITSLRHTEAAQARIVLTRAFMCAEMARESKDSSLRNKAFLTGLLSGCDILLGVNKEDFVQQLSISEQISNAILRYQGALGGLLKEVEQFEYDFSMKNTVANEAERISDFHHSSYQVQSMFAAMEA